MPKALEGIGMAEKSRVIDTGSLVNIARFCDEYTGKFGNGEYKASEKKNVWSGSYTWEDYKKYLKTGDPDTIARIRNKTRNNVNKLESKYKEQLITFMPDVEGMFFDIGAVLNGEPECWFREEIKNKKSQSISFVLNGAFGAGMDKDDIVDAGARILALCKVLEDHKVHTEILLICANRNVDVKEQGVSTYLMSKVKSFNEPLNYAKASALLSPTYQRRLMFKVVETMSDRVKSGYGQIETMDGVINLRNKDELDALEEKILGGGEKND